jgi:biopolymer transport protein ExbB/TolQ
MKDLRKILSTLMLSVVLFLTLLFSSSVAAIAAIAPDEAQNIMRDASSLQEAGQKLREADSSEKLRNNEALNTAKEVRKDRPAIDAKGNTIEEAKEGFKGFAENVKEKLNLDEPLPPSTKEFFGKREETVEPGGKVLVKEEPGYYQRERQTQVFEEEK